MGKITWQTFGFENIKDILNKQLESGVFPHAYLFAGASGVGKKTLAGELAVKILGAEKLGNHPDFHFLDAGGGIGVEQVRQFISSLDLRPFWGHYKVALIDNVQNINPQGFNALLKTVEEPSASTILILISSTRKLLPTLLSRCQIFSFNRLSLSQLQEFAAAQGWQADREMLILSFGQINRLQRLINEPDWAEEQKHMITELKTLRQASLGKRLAKIGELAELEEAQLNEKFVSWLTWSELALANADTSLFKSVQALYKAVMDMRTNKNTKLILQGLFFNL